jgi:group I intron endonuclease
LSRKRENNPVYGRTSKQESFVKKPGIYQIRCIKNNKAYYGQTENLSARLSAHKSRLQRREHEVPALQKDFILFGEKSFVFSVVYSYTNYNREELVAEESNLVDLLGDLCYNKFSKTSRKGKNNPMSGRNHSAETLERLSKAQAERTKNTTNQGSVIVLNGEKYSSISEASRQTKHTRVTISKWLNDPNNTKCVAFDACESSESQDNIIINTGASKAVNIKGNIYPSITQAAKGNNCTHAEI